MSSTTIRTRSQPSAKGNSLPAQTRRLTDACRKAEGTDPRETARSPFASLVFVLPFLAIYELGVLRLGPDAIRNGCDVWLRTLLGSMGSSEYFLLPAITCGTLLAWHHLVRGRWEVAPSTIAAMWWESFAFALVLALCGRLCFTLLPAGSLIDPRLRIPTLATASGADSLAARVAFMGAGIYEEAVFRLLAIPCIARFLRSLGESKEEALWQAALGTSLVFAAAHYRLFMGAGEEFAWSSFVFRAMAGGCFAWIFLRRGFGITVGAHALYDLIASA